MKNWLPHASVFQLSLFLLHTKQTHCKNVHCNSEHVLTLFSIAVCSHGEHHQESRLPCHTNTKQPASMHQLQSSWLLSAFVVLHMHMDICCTSSEAVASQHQPQSPRLLACSAVMWHTWQLEEKLLSTVSTPRTQQAWRHCTWCARIEWHCFSDSSAGPPCDVHIMIMFMYVVGRMGVERRCGGLLVGYDVCHLPSALLGAPWYRRTRVTRGPHRQRQACPILTTRAQFRCQSETERAQFCVLVQEFQHLEHFFWHWKNSSFFFAWSGQNVLTFRCLILWHLEVFFRYLNRSRCVTWRRAIYSVESSVLSTRISNM